MIIIDFSQIVISNYMMQNSLNKKKRKNTQDDYVAQQMAGAQDITLDFLRHLALDSIRNIIHKNRTKYGDNIIIAVDHPESWRKNVFPYYKASRKKNRGAIDIDWKLVFEALDTIYQELRDNFPYKVIKAENAEADDVIGVLVTEAYEPTLIVSADQDFIQLQMQPGVEQYDPIRKRMVQHPNPAIYLKEHLLKGDRGDGIPNFRSPDDVFVTPGARSKKIMAAKLKDWVRMKPKEFCSGEELRNYKRNEQLIRLDKIPDYIKQRILDEFNTPQHADKSKIYNYLFEKGLANLATLASQF